MIAANHEDFPELRLQFFSLLKAINQHSFPSLFAIPQEVRKNVVDAVASCAGHRSAAFDRCAAEAQPVVLSSALFAAACACQASCGVLCGVV